MKYIIDKLKDEDFVKLRFQSFKSDGFKINDYYVEIYNEKILNTKTFKDLIADGILREKNENLAYVDGVKLEIGKEYFFKYRYADAMWERKTVTRFTVNDHPWAGSGVVTDGLWLIDELDDETKLKEFARNWLNNNNITEKTISDIFVEMYNSYK